METHEIGQLASYGGLGVQERRLSVARACAAAVGAFIALVASLHFLEPQFGPMWRFVSEYATGPFGWVMKLAFFVLAFACAAALAAIRPYARGKSGAVGLFFLAVTIAGVVMAGFFDQDPISSRLVTREGNLHALATTLGIPGFTIASLLLGLNLARWNKEWASARRPLLWLSQLPWISLVVMFVYMSIVVPRAGGFGPTVWVGALNRLFLLAMCAWLFYIASHADRLERHRGRG
jgi:glucan phosphoethanolaminetransferase (alkaline phosphatase superfamily)